MIFAAPIAAVLLLLGPCVSKGRSLESGFDGESISEPVSDDLNLFRMALMEEWHGGEADFPATHDDKDLSADLKMDLEHLRQKYTDFFDQIINAEGEIDAAERTPPGWMFLVPSSLLASKLPQNDLGTFAADYYKRFNASGAAVMAKTASVAAAANDDERKEKFLGAFRGYALDEAPLRVVGAKAVNWWSEKEKAFVNVGTQSIRVLTVFPEKDIYDFESGMFENKDVLDIIESGTSTDWISATWGQVCLWNKAASRKNNVLRGIYDSVKAASENEAVKGFAPFLRCYSPLELTDWKSKSTRVANNKSPILKMIKRYQELELDPLQVRTLTECIVWSDSNLLERKGVFYLLDVTQFDETDLKDYTEKALIEHKPSWDFMLKVSLLKNIDAHDTLTALINESGPLYAVKPWNFSESGVLRAGVVNKVNGPWLRYMQSRSLMNHVPDDEIGKLSPGLGFGLRSDRLLRASSGYALRKGNAVVMTSTQQWAASRLIKEGKADASLYDPAILEWIHPQTVSRMTDYEWEYLPESKVRTEFQKIWRSFPERKTPEGNVIKEVISHENWRSNLPEYILGLTCESLSQASALDVPLLASYYVQRSSMDVRNDEISVFPSALRYCFKNRFIEYLRMKYELFSAGENSENDYWKVATTDEVVAMGGEILATFAVSDIAKIDNSRIKERLIGEIGRVPYSRLMTIVSYPKMKKLAALGAGVFGVGNTADFGTLAALGSLVYVLPEKMLDAHPFVIKAFVNNRMSGSEDKLVCLPEAKRIAWNDLLFKGYGVPWAWSGWDLLRIGDLLINLNSTRLYDIPSNAFRETLPLVLNSSALNQRFAKFPGFYGPTTFRKACASWLGEKNAESYDGAFESLMRMYLGVSQYGTLVAEREEKRVVIPSYLSSTKSVKDNLYVIYNDLVRRLQKNGDDLNDESKEYLKDLLIGLNSFKNKTIIDILANETETRSTSELYKAYRSGIDKDPAKIDAIETFLLEAQMYIIREVKYLFNFTGENEASEYSDEMLCATIGCIDDAWCGMYKCQTEGIGEKDLNLTCNGLIAGQASASSLKASDLSRWDRQDVLNCLDVLGSVRWTTRERKSEIWDAVKGHVDLKDPEQMLALGSLLEVVDPDDVVFESNYVDGIARLGEFEMDKSPSEKTVNGIRSYLTDAGDDLELRLVSLGHLLCALEGKEEIADIVLGDGEDFERLVVLGRLRRCDNDDFRKSVSTRIMKLYENRQMPPSDISALGLFASELDAEILANFTDDQLQAIQTSAAHYLKADQLENLTVQRVSRLAPESLSVLEDSQIPDDFAMTATQTRALWDKGTPNALIGDDDVDSESEAESAANANRLTFAIIFFYFFTQFL